MQVASLLLISHQDALMRAMDVVSNNVANSDTTGFKRQELQFETMVVRPEPNEKMDFAVDRGTLRDAGQGPLLTTGNPFDVAVQGKGYFIIQTNEGTRYTRDGSFVLNGQGEMVTGGGDKLLGEGDQPIALPSDASDVHISADGVVTAKSGASTAVTQVGKLKLVKFENEQSMKLEGKSLYSTAQTAQPDTESRLIQGTVERSNVRAVTEITNMIGILRSYQMSVRLLDQDNQRQTNAISRLSKATA